MKDNKERARENCPTCLGDWEFAATWYKAPEGELPCCDCNLTARLLDEAESRGCKFAMAAGIPSTEHLNTILKERDAAREDLLIERAWAHAKKDNLKHCEAALAERDASLMKTRYELECAKRRIKTLEDSLAHERSTTLRLRNGPGPYSWMKDLPHERDDGGEYYLAGWWCDDCNCEVGVGERGGLLRCNECDGIRTKLA